MGRRTDLVPVLCQSLGEPVTDQPAMADQHAFVRDGERAAHVAHEQVGGKGCRAHDLHPAHARSITKTV